MEKQKEIEDEDFKVVRVLIDETNKALSTRRNIRKVFDSGSTLIIAALALIPTALWIKLVMLIPSVLLIF